MIPKIIHYCWFGGNDLPEIAEKCIKSWKKYCPDYEIKLWNEDNFDISLVPYVKEAYDNKKYAFVADYARLWILYNYGGLYLDIDVEIIKPLDNLLNCNSFFGSENNENISTGLCCGAKKGNFLIKKMLDDYNDVHFVKSNGELDLTTCVERNAKSLKKVFLDKIDNKNVATNIDGNYYYPKDYFCPISSKTTLLTLTDNTYSIHHFAATWVDDISKEYSFFRKCMIRKYGVKKGSIISKILFFFKHPIFIIRRASKKFKKTI